MVLIYQIRFFIKKPVVYPVYLCTSRNCQETTDSICLFKYFILFMVFYIHDQDHK